MSEYLNIKILEDKVKNLKKALKKSGINARSNAEAINILIDNFLLKSNIDFVIPPNNQEGHQNI